MIADPQLRAKRFAAIARPSRRLALVAIDQRESLREMHRRAGFAGTDDELRMFKVAAARVLSPRASGLLVDPAYGLEAILQAAALAPGCGLVVAADRIAAVGDEVVGSSELDEDLDLDAIVAGGAVALKLLVLWRVADAPEPRLAMVRRFVERCAELEVLSLVEGVVRGVDPRRDPTGHAGSVRAAARELTAAGPDLYKAEVPTHGLAAADTIEAASWAVTDSISCPWVVLSAGTAPDAFPDGVRAACRGGASGFLAGRAIWAPALAASTDAADLDRRLEQDAVARLERLIAIVEAPERSAQP